MKDGTRIKISFMGQQPLKKTGGNSRVAIAIVAASAADNTVDAGDFWFSLFASFLAPLLLPIPPILQMLLLPLLLLLMILLLLLLLLLLLMMLKQRCVWGVITLPFLF